MAAPLIAGLGMPELIVILIVVIVLFGASKLPDLARNSGQALRIFKAETKGLIDGDDDDAKKTPEQLQIDERAKLDQARAAFEAEKAKFDQDRRTDGA